MPGFSLLSFLRSPAGFGGKSIRLLVNDVPILVLGKDGVTSSKSAKCRPSTRPGSPILALRNMFVSDVGAAERSIDREDTFDRPHGAKSEGVRSRSSNALPRM